MTVLKNTPTFYYQQLAVSWADGALKAHIQVDEPISSVASQLESRSLTPVHQPSSEIALVSSNHFYQSLQKWTPVAKKTGVLLGGATGGILGTGATLAVTAGIGAFMTPALLGPVLVAGAIATPVVGLAGLALGLSASAPIIYKNEISVFKQNLETKVITDGFLFSLTDPLVLSSDGIAGPHASKKQQEVCAAVSTMECKQSVLDALETVVKYETDANEVEVAVKSLSLMGSGGLKSLISLKEYLFLKEGQEAGTTHRHG